MDAPILLQARLNLGLYLAYPDDAGLGELR